jgi:hypothetical protein
MEAHECSAGDETTMLQDIHWAIQEGPGTYQCTVPHGVGIIAAAREVKFLFPEVEPDSIEVNMEEGILRFTTAGRSIVH